MMPVRFLLIFIGCLSLLVFISTTFFFKMIIGQGINDNSHVGIISEYQQQNQHVPPSPKISQITDDEDIPSLYPERDTTQLDESNKIETQVTFSSIPSNEIRNLLGVLKQWGITVENNGEHTVATKHLNDLNSCENTAQGRTQITDSHGYVCHVHDIDPSTGCCTSGDRDACNDDEICWGPYIHCCSKYEHCVSCCLDPSNSVSLAYQFILINATTPKMLNNVRSMFSFCKIRCRTSSKSLSHQNRYKSRFKHCYGTGDPPHLDD
eukprot:gb/GECH01000827.1/.p1 GENE.gb/GECH01000827.1/~~gb/GECH01000827.1/.p1  ORF type:complete len:265 (+),score=43.22 gb/GECH01000827.1/:1-795(+)